MVPEAKKYFYNFLGFSQIKQCLMGIVAINMMLTAFPGSFQKDPLIIAIARDQPNVDTDQSSFSDLQMLMYCGLSS